MLKTLIQIDQKLESLLNSYGYKNFSTKFIKNILTSVDVYIDLSPKEGFYSLLARSYYPHLKVVANEPNASYAQSLNQTIANFGLENITLQVQRDQLKETITDLSGENSCNKAMLIRAVIAGDGLVEMRWISEFIEKFENIKLIIEFDQTLIAPELNHFQRSMEEIFKKDFEIWALDDQSEQFSRVSSQNLIQSIQLLNSHIFYCVKKSQALSICFFSHSPLIGGSEKMMFDLASSLVKDYGVVCTAVLPRPGPQSEALREIGVATLFAFSSFPFYGWWCDDAGSDRPKGDQQLQIINASKAIEMHVLESLHKVDPDVIWTQSMVIPWGAKVAEILNKPHIWYVTEFGELDFGFRFFNPFADVLEEIQATSNHVYTCSQVLKDTLFPMAEKEKVSTLYTHIPPPVIEMTGNSEQYFLKKDSVKIGMFSQIRPTKGQEDSVLAVAECIRNGLNVELLIVGDAADPIYQNYLMFLAEDLGVKDNIIFTGYATKPFDLMVLCDIVVMASRLEAFGRVGVEAMLLNKPVVFANTGGISEYQLNGQTGLSFTPGDSHDLAMQLRLLINDPALRKKMGIAAQEHALNLFSKENFSDRVYFETKKIATQGRGDCSNPKIVDQLIRGATEGPGIKKNIKKFIGRNEVCPCNSGKKYKHCCGIIG